MHLLEYSTKNNRETEPSGLGWELFENYLIAKEKFKPDFFLYENNKSAAQAIKDEIKKRFNVWDGTLLTPDSGARYIEINSALVSAQNRQRFTFITAAKSDSLKTGEYCFEIFWKAEQGGRINRMPSLPVIAEQFRRIR